MWVLVRSYAIDLNENGVTSNCMAKSYNVKLCFESLIRVVSTLFGLAGLHSRVIVVDLGPSPILGIGTITGEMLPKFLQEISEHVRRVEVCI